MSLEEIEQLYYTRVSVGQLFPEIKRIYDGSELGTDVRARAAFLMGVYHRRVDRDAALKYYDEVQVIASELKLTSLLSGYLQFQAERAVGGGNLANAIRLNEQALSHARDANFHYGECEAYYLSGRVAFRQGVHDVAFEFLNQALQIAQVDGFLKRQAEISSTFAEFYLIASQFATSERYAGDALRLTRELSWEPQIPKAAIRLATAQLELGKYEEVIALVREVRTKLSNENHSGWSTTHTLLAKVHEAKRRYSKAEEEFRAALSLADYVNAERVRSNVHTHLAELYLKIKRPKPALKEALAALEDAEKAQDMYTRKEALRTIHAAYKALGKYKQAHEYLERYNTIIAESDTQLLKSRLEYHALKSDFEQEKVKSESQTKASELLKLKLEYKERELAEHVRHLVKQAETLKQFRNDLRALIRRTPANDPSVKEIRERLAAFPEEEINWQELEKEFAEAHPEFLPTLSKRYPDLTQMERRVAAMVQMDLKSSDVAQLFCITERAVEFHRLNLRKKLRLRKGEDLRRILTALPAAGGEG